MTAKGQLSGPQSFEELCSSLTDTQSLEGFLGNNGNFCSSVQLEGWICSVHSNYGTPGCTWLPVSDSSEVGCVVWCCVLCWLQQWFRETLRTLMPFFLQLWHSTSLVGHDCQECGPFPQWVHLLLLEAWLLFCPWAALWDPFLRGGFFFTKSTASSCSEPFLSKDCCSWTASRCLVRVLAFSEVSLALSCNRSDSDLSWMSTTMLSLIISSLISPYSHFWPGCRERSHFEKGTELPDYCIIVLSVSHQDVCGWESVFCVFSPAIEQGTDFSSLSVSRPVASQNWLNLRFHFGQMSGSLKSNEEGGCRRTLAIPTCSAAGVLLCSRNVATGNLNL